MKRNILHTVVLFSALALASCSTTNKMASTQVDDDVYFTKAEAGDAPVYRQPIREERYVATDGAEGDDDDYYYYDSYSSRINRFAYNSPFDYYDDYYYGYSPYAYNNFGYGGFGYGGGWGLGIGLGYGYGGWGSPFGYGGYGYGGFGYGGFGYGGFYSPYSYWGTGYGYGGGYWGTVSANNVVSTARPYRGAGFPGSNMSGRTASSASSARPVGYRGNYPNAMNYPGRAANSVNGAANGNAYGGRPTRIGANGATLPTYRPTRTDVSRPTQQPTFDRGSTSSSGGGNTGGGGGSRGGGRPSRP